MSSRSLSLIRSIASRIAQPFAAIERRARAFWSRTPSHRRFARVTGIVLFGCMSIVVMGDNGCGACKTNAASSGPGPVILTNYILGLAGVHYHTSLRPQFTGTDNSQTGTASFQGNFTSITQPTSTYFAMLRMSDCSLALITGTTPSNGIFSVGTTASTNYEQTLHQLAGLKTTPDVFASGCKEGTTDLSARVGVFAGVTKSNIAVMATAEGNGANNAVFVLTSNASQSNVTFNPLPGTTAATGLVTADLNGDGSGDLVAVNGYNATSSYVTVLLGNADGTFKTAVNYPTAGNYSATATLDDINGDGNLDIVSVSADQQISILTGNGDGTFNAAQSFAAPALPGSSLPASSTPITNIITADVNGDGKRDLVCSNGLVLLGDGHGNFTAVASAAFPYTQGSSNGGPFIAAGDINNDGKPDLVLDTGTSISTWIGKGDGTFTAGRSYASINNSGYITLVDLDGDGNLDIYSGLADGGLYSGDDTNNNTAYVLMGNGDGTFVGAPSASTGVYNGTNLGDVNGDGVPDLITNGTVNANTAYFTVQLGNGKGAFTPGATITAPASFTGTTSALTSPATITNANTVAATSYAVADVNGDGKADLIFVDNGLNATTASNQSITYPSPVYFVAISNGDGTFKTPVPYNFPQIAPSTGFDIQTTASNLQVADFNHDGKPDLIFNYNDQAGGPGTVSYYQGLVVLLGVGNGTFSTTPILTSTYSSNTAPNTAALPQVVSTTDLNSDNKPDLIVLTPSFSIANGASNQLLTYIGNGDGTFKSPTTLGISANPYGTPVLADFNKDGRIDIAFLAETTASQAELAIALGNGDGTFAAPTILNLTGGDAVRSDGLAAADFDGDGNVDLALFDNNDYSGIFYGTGTGVFTSVPATGYLVPKDLINLAATNGGAAVAVDLNKDGKPDILAGSTVLLNAYGAAPVVTTSTTTALTATATTITVGNSITFTATVTQSSGSTAPTGTVTFMDGSTALCSAVAVSSSKASCTTSALTAGSYSITAIYSGDANYTTSTSTALLINVNTVVQAATATTLLSSAGQGTVGTSITFTGVVTLLMTGSPVTTGTVTFTDIPNGTPASTITLGTASVDSTGRATFTTTALVAGSNYISAVYAASPAYGFSESPATTINIVKITPTVTVTPTPANLVTNQALSVAVTVSGTPIPTGTIALSNGATALATSPLIGGSATFALPAGTFTAGTVALNAVYTPDTNSSATYNNSTGTASVTVTAPPPPAFTLTGAAASIPTPGQTATSTITVTPSGGFTGSVALTAALTFSPTGATSLPTFSFNSTTPVSVTTASAATGTLTIYTTAATSALNHQPTHPRWYATTTATLACVLLFGIRTRRRNLRTTLTLLILSLGLVSLTLTACGKSSPATTTNNGSPGTTVGSYTITVTGASGATTSQTTVTLTVQ